MSRFLWERLQPRCFSLLERLQPRCFSLLKRLQPRCFSLLERLQPRCFFLSRLKALLQGGGGVAVGVLLVCGSAHAQSAEMETVRRGDTLIISAVNRSAGPVEVELDGIARGDTPLPVRAVVPANRAIVLLQVPAAAGAPQLELRSVPGEPHAVARDVVYSLPVEESNFQLGQGFHGGFSHADPGNRYAVDLIVPEGTPVFAARAGIVVQTRSGHSEGGVDPSLRNRANLVRVLHDDGSMALYAHLRENGVTVRPGQHVSLGQILGYTGNTGFSSGPHLHFAVQVNVGMRLESVPFRMIGPRGLLPLDQR